MDLKIVEREMTLGAKRKKLCDMWEEYVFTKNVQSYAHQNASLLAEAVVMAPFTVSALCSLFSLSLSFFLPFLLGALSFFPD
jgi:hypothetical protein